MKTLINRGAAAAFRPDPDGWVHLATYGEHPHGQGDDRVVQVVDRVALESILSNFRREARPRLLDFDHESHDPAKPTLAAGWMEELAARNDGLWARVRWSDAGDDAVRHGRYRYLSPVWTVTALGHGRVRPSRLLDAALTNQPNLSGLAPISNRRAAPAPTQDHTMKTVATLLGLNEAADEAQIAAAVRTLQDETKANRAALDTLKTERDTLITAQVEADLEKHAAVIANRDQVKAALLKDRSGTLALLAALAPQKAAPAAALTNRAGAQPPPTQTPGADEPAVLRNRLISAKRAGGLSYEQAYLAAKAEKPELFVAAS